MTTVVSKKSHKFGGHAKVPGDKSIAIRALILSGLANGTSRILGLPPSDDVFSAKKVLQQLGAGVSESKDVVTVRGVGKAGFRPPEGVLDFGNSGTASRLMMGALAGEDLRVTLTGDVSLQKRPFGRITEPLSVMGARFDGETLPIIMHGTKSLKPFVYPLRVPSAQVKSAILFAALKSTGESGVMEQIPTRDHTERMLGVFGVKVQETQTPGGRRITLLGPQILNPTSISIPGDISAAAFLIVAALITKSTDLLIEGVGVNPTRTRFVDVLRKMGAGISVQNPKNDSGEIMGDISVTPGKLRGVTTTPEEASSLIDEFPALFVAAAFAEGRSEFQGLGELRFKESDRLKIMAGGLRANGVKAEVTEDTLVIDPGPVRGGAIIDAWDDHRIAMAFLVLGLAAENPVRVVGAETISTSFPGFAKVMAGLGAEIKEGI